MIANKNTAIQIVGLLNGIFAEPASQTKYDKKSKPAVRDSGYPLSDNPENANLRMG